VLRAGRKTALWPALNIAEGKDLPSRGSSQRYGGESPHMPHTLRSILISSLISCFSDLEGRHGPTAPPGTNQTEKMRYDKVVGLFEQTLVL
jgi:hypothetical protein